MHSFAHGHGLIPQHGRLHICWLCVFNTVLHLFHHPGTCSFSCIRFCICMQVSYFPTSTLGSDTVIVLQFGLKENKCEKTTCLLPGVGFIFSITHSNLLAAQPNPKPKLQTRTNYVKLPHPKQPPGMSCISNKTCLMTQKSKSLQFLYVRVDRSLFKI